MTHPIAIVLAGGASRRFGSNKLAADVRGIPLIHHALLAAAEVAREVVLVIGPDAAPPALPDGLTAPVRIARDPELHGGPLIGLAAGLEAIDDRDAIVLLVGGDMPALRPDVLGLLVEALRTDSSADFAVLEHERFAPFPTALRVTPAQAAATAALATGRRSITACFGRLRQVTVPATTWRAIDPDAATLRDIDRPGDGRGLD